MKTVVFNLADEVRNHLSHTIPDGWISRKAPIARPPKSVDLTFVDFFPMAQCEEFDLPDQKQLLSAVKSPHKGQCGSGNPQHALKHTDRS